MSIFAVLTVVSAVLGVFVNLVTLQERREQDFFLSACSCCVGRDEGGEEEVFFVGSRPPWRPSLSPRPSCRLSLAIFWRPRRVAEEKGGEEVFSLSVRRSSFLSRDASARLARLGGYVCAVRFHILSMRVHSAGGEGQAARSYGKGMY